MELKEDAQDYGQKLTIERIIQQYSTFIPFPVKMEGKKVNKVEAIWLRAKSEIKDEEYTEFYKFIGNGYDEPLYRYHFAADTPLAINALLFVPKENLEPIDDFVLSHLGTFDEKKLLSADRSDLRLPENTEKKEDAQDDASKERLAEAIQTSLCKWMKEVLGDKVKEVKPSTRLVDSPAMIVNADGYMTSSMERILAAQGRGGKDNPMMISAKKEMEINPASPLIKKVADLRVKDQDFAKELTEQIFDNAMIQAGLLIDPQQMVSRSYRILERVARIRSAVDTVVRVKLHAGQDRTFFLS